MQAREVGRGREPREPEVGPAAWLGIRWRRPAFPAPSWGRGPGWKGATSDGTAFLLSPEATEPSVCVATPEERSLAGPRGLRPVLEATQDLARVEGLRSRGAAGQTTTSRRTDLRP